MIKKIAKNTLFLTYQDIIDKVLTVIFLIFLTRYLGPEEFGKYSFAYAFVSLFSIFIAFGLEPLIVREVARDFNLTNKYFINVSFIKLFFCFISLVLICICLSLMQKSVDIFVMVLVVFFAFFPGCIASVLVSLFNSHQSMEYPSIIAIITRIITISLSIYLLFLGFGTLSIMIIGSFGSIISLVSLFYFRKKINLVLNFKIDIPFCKELIKKAIPFFGFSVLATYYWKIDMTMLSCMKGNIAVGQYSAAYRIIDALLFIPGGFMVSIYPIMSKLFITDLQKLKKMFEISFKYLFLLILPITTGIILLADKIILLLFKEKYLPSVPALQILMLALLFLYIKYPLGNLFTSINKMHILTISTAFGLIINVLLNLFFIKKWSFIGASITTFMCEAITFLVLIYLAVKYFNNFKFLNFIFKPLFVTFLISIYIFFFKEINLFLLIFSTAIFYFCLLFLFKVFSETDINIVKQIYSQIFVKLKGKNKC